MNPSDMARALQALRKTRSGGHEGGRPRVMRPCRFCRKRFGGRELRAHLPHCEKRPEVKAQP